jgi:hypothetical protein
MKDKEKIIENSFVFITTAQFLLDFAEENIVPQQWCTNRLKSSLKTTISLMEKRINLLFGKGMANDKAMAQHFNASVIMENNMRLILHLGKQSKEVVKNFEQDYAELLRKYNALNLDYTDLDNHGI